MSEASHTKVTADITCPECRRFITLPQDHTYRCSHWFFVSPYSPRGQFTISDSDNPPEVGHL